MAPISVERFSVLQDGRVRYELRKAAGGRTELHLDPLDPIHRLVAPLPAPYGSLIGYHGIFAN
ncbi:MAG: hypothetical protein AMXMBFR64_63030 [Myxococcales bacterium]